MPWSPKLQSVVAVLLALSTYGHTNEDACEAERQHDVSVSFIQSERRISGATHLSGKHNRDDCDAEVPEYSMEEWIAAHGKNALPDHPAIFTGHKVEDGYESYAGLDHFLQVFGDDQMTFYPEYGQPGGFGAQYWNHAVRKAPIRQIAQTWNETHAYAGYFVCDESPSCSKMYKHLGTPILFEGPKSSINFLIGGPETGLPFHWHEKTWQGLLAGQKVWYLVPPDAMTEELHDLTGPLVLPARGWAKLVDGLPLGKRPIRCVQHPGDILYFPDWWYHATLNLDEFQLGWGAKPDDRSQFKDNAQASVIRRYFPESQVKFDTLPSQLTGHYQEYERECKANQARATAAVDKPLQKLTALAKAHHRQAGNNATQDALAFALCALSLKIDTDPVNKCVDSQSLSQKWQAMAQDISPTVSKVECVPF